MQLKSKKSLPITFFDSQSQVRHRWMHAEREVCRKGPWGGRPCNEFKSFRKNERVEAPKPNMPGSKFRLPKVKSKEKVISFASLEADFRSYLCLSRNPSSLVQ